MTTSQSIGGFADLTPLQKRWSMVRHELVYWLFALLELSLIVPIGLALFSSLTWTATGSLLRLLLIFLTPLYMVRLLTFLEIPAQQRRQSILGLGLLVVLFSVSLLNGRSPFWFGWFGEIFTSMSQMGNTLWHQYVGTFVLVGVTWWRGTYLLALDPNAKGVGKHLRLGGLAGIPIMLLLTLRLETIPWSPIWFVVLFFVTGLLEMSLVRIEETEREQKESVTSATPLWFARLGALSASLVAVAWGFGVFVGGETARGLASLFSPLWSALQFFATTTTAILAIFLGPVIFVFETAFNSLVAFWNEQFMRVLENATEPAIDPTGSGVGAAPDVEIQTPTTPIGDFIDWQLLTFIVVLVIIFGVIAFIIWRGRVQVRANGNGRFTRTRNIPYTGQIDPPDGLADQLRRRFNQKEREEAAQSVRFIYADLVAFGAQCGYPRETAVTAYEHIQTLRHVWPNHVAALRKITTAYVNIRYGAYPETQHELNEIIRAWEQIQQTEPQVHIPQTEK